MKKSLFRVGFVAAALLLSAIYGGGCSLNLDNEDERETVYVDKNGYAKHVLTESTAVNGVTTSTGLTLVFQTSGSVADDQLILFKGTSNSKTVTVRSGYLGDWAVWDSGINDGSATSGSLSGTGYNVMKNAFTGNDGCAFVFKVDDGTTNSIYYYINGELALAWEKVETTFCAALIDAITTSGLSFIDNSDSTSSTLAMSGDVYYIASAVDSATGKSLSAKPSSTTTTTDTDTSSDTSTDTTSEYEFSDENATEISKTAWSLTQTAEKYGVFLCLDSTDNGTSYNMTVDSITINGDEQLDSAVNITTDIYINEYSAATSSSDAGTKACAKELEISNSSSTIVYTVSDITVTGVTPEFWGVYNFGFTDTSNSIKYACRSDGWNNDLADYMTGYPTGDWASGSYTDGTNILLSTPYNTGKIKLVLKIDNSTKVATFTVYRVTN